KDTPVPLAEQVQRWRAEVSQLSPDTPVDAVIAACVPAVPTPPASAPPDFAALAAEVIDTVSDMRSSWTVYHVRAEAYRRLWNIPFDSVQDRQNATETVVRYALERESVQLDLTADATPILLRRAEGEPL